MIFSQEFWLGSVGTNPSGRFHEFECGGKRFSPHQIEKSSLFKLLFLSLLADRTGLEPVPRLRIGVNLIFSKHLIIKLLNGMFARF
jgi:hypothetical protein